MNAQKASREEEVRLQAYQVWLSDATEEKQNFINYFNKLPDRDLELVTRKPDIGHSFHADYLKEVDTQALCIAVEEGWREGGICITEVDFPSQTSGAGGPQPERAKLNDRLKKLLKSKGYSQALGSMEMAAPNNKRDRVGWDAFFANIRTTIMDQIPNGDAEVEAMVKALEEKTVEYKAARE